MGYTLPLNARVSHAYVKVNVEVCCFAQDGGPADNLLHACLTDGAADTADDLLANAADAVSRCTILELPENEKNGGCDNNRPDRCCRGCRCGATDACEFVEAAALIELAAGTTGGGVLVFGYPSSDHGIKIKKAEAYDCDAAGACCRGRSSTTRAATPRSRPRRARRRRRRGGYRGGRSSSSPSSCSSSSASSSGSF